MKIQCPECKAAYNIDGSKIPDSGVYARCRKCQARFLVSKQTKSQEASSAVKTEQLHTKVCPRCSYHRQPDDDKFTASTECPKCGVIYDKARVEKVDDRKISDEKSSELAQISNRAIQTTEAHRGVGVLKGRIIEAIEKRAHPIAKLFAGLMFLFMFLYYLIAIGLCLTIIGALFGIPMLVGAMAVQRLLLMVFNDGTKYKIQCPVCQGRIDNVFKPVLNNEISSKCPSCKKDIIVRGKEVLHFSV
jgi:predicted Zn finger-like uncharacterized protein